MQNCRQHSGSEAEIIWQGSDIYRQTEGFTLSLQRPIGQAKPAPGVLQLQVLQCGACAHSCRQFEADVMLCTAVCHMLHLPLMKAGSTKLNTTCSTIDNAYLACHLHTVLCTDAVGLSTGATADALQPSCLMWSPVDGSNGLLCSRSS